MGRDAAHGAVVPRPHSPVASKDADGAPANRFGSRILGSYNGEMAERSIAAVSKSAKY